MSLHTTQLFPMAPKGEAKEKARKPKPTKRVQILDLRIFQALVQVPGIAQKQTRFWGCHMVKETPILAETA